MIDFLNEALQELEDIRSGALASLKHMRAELDSLKKKNEAAVAKVMADNNDLAAHRAMEESDAAIQRLKDETAQYREEAVKRLRDMRQEIEHLRDTRLEEMKKELAETRDEHETLHAELIPRAQATLDGYLERKKALEAKTLTLMSRVNELQQWELSGDSLKIE